MITAANHIVQWGLTFDRESQSNTSRTQGLPLEVFRMPSNGRISMPHV